MVAVLNSLRAQKGKPTMGFLNPWLYKFGRHGLTEYVYPPFPIFLFSPSFSSPFPFSICLISVYLQNPPN